MKQKIMLSINPEHVENIINGNKKFEYRTKRPQKNIASIVIYATAPVKKVVAEVDVLGIKVDTPSNIWELTKDGSGIAKEFFDKYFKNRKQGYAYILQKVNVFETPRTLKDYGIKHAPQSFVYLKEEQK